MTDVGLQRTNRTELCVVGIDPIGLCECSDLNQQFNVTNMFKSNDAQNTFNQDKWKKQMEVWGAGKTADAQQRASGGGGKK